MRNSTTHYKHYALFALLSIAVITAKAQTTTFESNGGNVVTVVGGRSVSQEEVPVGASKQKLPGVQTISLRAPANIKIDGKTTEWDNKFQGYNRNTDLFYIMSNDDDYLYLTLQANDPAIVRHILAGGFTLTINQSGKKGDRAGIAVTYPIFDKANRLTVNFRNRPKLEKGSDASVKKADSNMYAVNKSMNEKVKLIKVTGVKDIDTLISVYNEDGIKVAAAFDNELVYTCELAISLKHLGLAINNGTKFAYNIMLNEVIQSGIDIKKDPSGNIVSMSVNKGAQPAMPPTDFWGEYTLAKK